MSGDAPLSDKTVLMLVEDTYEDLELHYPRLRLIEAGARVLVAGPEAGRTYRGKHGLLQTAEVEVAGQDPADFDALVIPGGFAPDRLRRDDDVLRLTRGIHEAGKVVAHICHAGWVPISAGIVEGYRVTSTPAIRDDLTNAGATWVDAPVVVDRNQITSRRPPDLPDFLREIIAALR